MMNKQQAFLISGFFFLLEILYLFSLNISFSERWYVWSFTLLPVIFLFCFLLSLGNSVDEFKIKHNSMLEDSIKNTEQIKLMLECFKNQSSEFIDGYKNVSKEQYETMNSLIISQRTTNAENNKLFLENLKSTMESLLNVSYNESERLLAAQQEQSKETFKSFNFLVIEQNKYLQELFEKTIFKIDANNKTFFDNNKIVHETLLTEISLLQKSYLEKVDDSICKLTNAGIDSFTQVKTEFDSEIVLFKEAVNELKIQNTFDVNAFQTLLKELINK